MIKISNISCVIIAKNAQETLIDVLNALKNFEEIILYSNNSTDKTNSIVLSYKNVKLIQGEFIGFGPTKNIAASYATKDWIFSLDADEVVSKDFIHNLSKTKLSKNCIYSILRTNFYKKRQIKHCWANDEIIRIYNKRTTAFTDKYVHEHIMQKDLKIEKIKGFINHYPYTSIESFIEKTNIYSTLFAKNNVGKKSSSPSKAFCNGLFSFIKTYFFKQGFLDGYAGLVIAFSHMTTNFYKYIKLYELNQELKSK